MLTPKHEALLATLLGMTVGVSAFGILVAIRDEPLTGGDTLPVVATPTPTPEPADGSLDGTTLTFAAKSLGPGGTVDVPADWKQSEDDGRQTRFDDPTGLWMIRIDQKDSDYSPARMVADRVKKVAGATDLRIVSEDSNTLVYTYVRNGRQRMVLSRWISRDGGKQTAAEITVAGRPQDSGGLAVVLAKATESFTLA
jgi:hypothetical protein